MKVVLLGTAHPFRGGLASFNERLILEFIRQGHEASISTFTTQYPGILFPGTSQFSKSPAPDIPIKREVSSIDPVSWWRLGRKLKKQSPDILIIKYWLPFMAPCFGTVAAIARKNKHTKVICIADNIIPHEPKFYDRFFTRYFLKRCDAFITMSNSVLHDLAAFDRKKLRASNPHPLFDNFGSRLEKTDACRYLNIFPDKKYILFFGFIRDYKGLDLLLQALQDERLSFLHLIVAGEFYTDDTTYKELGLQLGDRIHWFDRFIADEEVANFFSVADLVVQPYKQATQSGVTQIAYHFEVPMVVTNVGGLPELVPDGVCGLVTEPEPDQIADAIAQYFGDGLQETLQAGIREQKQRFSWDRMVGTITQLYDRLPGRA